MITAAGIFVGGLFAGILMTGPHGDLALAQPMRAGSAGGVMAFTGQIDRDEYGIIMVDADAGTLWIYHLKRPGNQLKLLAARSWMYDRYLEEYNCAPPVPSEVAQLVVGQEEPPPDVKKLENPPTEPLK